LIMVYPSRIAERQAAREQKIFSPVLINIVLR
jgi:hypothetical protein